MIKTATIRRYQGHDEHRLGIPDGTLVAVIDADYDDEKYIVCFTLPDLRDPDCSAYLSDVGPALATIDVVQRAGEPWGMVPADPGDIPRVIAEAEAFEARTATALADHTVRIVLQTLARAGVTADQLQAAYSEVTR